MYRLDPAPWKVREGGEVLGPRQHRGLEAAHGTGRGRAVLHSPAADELADHRVAPQPVGVVDVLIARQPREDRLAEQPGETAPTGPPGARVADQPGGQVRQAKRVVKFPMQLQIAIRTDRRTPEFHLHRGVKFQPKRPRFRFTRRVLRQIPTHHRQDVDKKGYHLSAGREIVVYLGYPGPTLGALGPGLR
jgi:hypothetical protein